MQPSEVASPAAAGDIADAYAAESDDDDDDDAADFDGGGSDAACRCAPVSFPT